MTRETIHRTAQENVYLHPDFHGALSCGLDYLEETYGADAVREYLHGFARSFYAPLTEALRACGLVALQEHFARLYELEGGDPRFSLTEDELWIEVDACPAVRHMRAHGYPVARSFVETTRTVNEALCEDTPYAAELLAYDEPTGASRVRFYRRAT